MCWRGFFFNLGWFYNLVDFFLMLFPTSLLNCGGCYCGASGWFSGCFCRIGVSATPPPPFLLFFLLNWDVGCYLCNALTCLFFHRGGAFGAGVGGQVEF